MYDAYTVRPIATKLPANLAIESISGDDRNDSLYAGLKSGILLVYSPPPKEDQECRYNMQTYRNFAKKSVMQTKILSELQILVCLSDTIITVHDCSQSQTHFATLCSLSTAKDKKVVTGCSLFAAEVMKSETDDGWLEAVLCVVVKRKVLLYYWKNRDFVEMNPSELLFPDVPKSVVWCGRKRIAVGLRDEYFLVPLNTDKDAQFGQSLFNTGSKAVDPLIFKIANRDVIGFLRDDRTVFRNYDGEAVANLSDITWSDVPLAIEYDSPYLVALLSKQVEIRSFSPSVWIQSIDLSRAKFLVFCSPGQLFAGGSNDLWSFGQNAGQNVDKLLKDKQYDLAVQLAQNVKDERPDETRERISKIKHLWAFHLFCLRKFKEAFTLYAEIGTEVLYVIGLFPDLLPEEIELHKNLIKYPGQLPRELPKTDLEKGLEALAEYLSEVRTNIARDLARQSRFRPNELHLRASEAQILEWQNLLQIVDTTLLKCYLQTNEMLVASLLRLPDNSCNVAECERALLKYDKQSELLLLYERRQMHAEALELLQKHAKNSKSKLRGVEHTIRYLQDLGSGHLELILKYSRWVLRENPEEGLRIFTEEIKNVENLPREQVLDFLRREAYGLVIPYLEHVIYVWGEEGPKFHDALAEQFVTKVKLLILDYLQSLPEGHIVASAGKEVGELGEMRKRFLKFLESSHHYSPDLLIVQLPHDALYEERALLYERMRRHEQAIAIYTNILHDYDRAEKYCLLNYNKQNRESAEVFLTLLRMYANPPENSSVLGVMHASTPKQPPNVKLALRVLKNYAHLMDTVKAIELLPPDIKLDQLWITLETLLSGTAVKRKEVQLHCGLYWSQRLRCLLRRAHAQSVKLVIDQDSVCAKCNKRIGSSAFVRCPDKSIVHYCCHK